MMNKIVTATRIAGVSPEQYQQAQQQLGGLIKQQARAISDAVRSTPPRACIRAECHKSKQLNARIFLNSSQPILYSYYAQRFLGVTAYAQWRPVELDEATGLASIPAMSNHCSLTQPTVECIIKIRLFPEKHDEDAGSCIEKSVENAEVELTR